MTGLYEELDQDDIDMLCEPYMSAAHWHKREVDESRMCSMGGCGQHRWCCPDEWISEADLVWWCMVAAVGVVASGGWLSGQRRFAWRWRQLVLFSFSVLFLYLPSRLPRV